MSEIKVHTEKQFATARKKNILRGFYKIPERDYFASPEMSNSDLGQLRKSPYAFKYYKENGGMDKTPAMELGSLVHSMYLEPETVAAEWVVEVACDRRTKLGKQLYAEFQKANEHRTIVKAEIWDKAVLLTEQLDKRVGKIEKLAGVKGHPEVSGYWNLNGVGCRGRFDYLAEDCVIWDLKTTSSLIDFAKSVANFGYHRQAAFYGMGLRELTGKFRGFKFVVVESQAPYDAAVLSLNIDSLLRGKKEIVDLFDLYKQCSETNSWPGAFEMGSEIGLPRWY